MSFPRLTPSFAVAVLALVVASGGAGFAAGQITSAQIRDNTIQSRDVANNSLTGTDVRNNSITGSDVRPGSLPRNRVSRACARGEVRIFAGCMRRAPFARSTFAAAVDRCARRGGRLPTTGELKYLITRDDIGWADGNPNNYEFSSSYTSENPFTPLGFDRTGFWVYNASAQLFWHHCITD